MKPRFISAKQADVVHPKQVGQRKIVPWVTQFVQRRCLDADRHEPATGAPRVVVAVAARRSGNER